MKIRVLIADDHNLFRAGVRGLLKGFGGIEVTGEAVNGHEAVAMAGKQRPDVLLMDVGMPGLNGIEAAERVPRRPRRWNPPLEFSWWRTTPTAGRCSPRCSAWRGTRSPPSPAAPRRCRSPRRLASMSR